MRQQPVTRPQVSGYRFHLRQLENAVVRRDVRGFGDPLRSQSRALAVGIVLAAVVLAGSALFGLIRPKSHVGTDPIVVTKESGAMFVRINDTLHPVLNLASARLIAGSAAQPVVVSEKALADLPRGPLVGIPGAPSAMPYNPKSAGHLWAVCDLANDGRLQSTVVVGQPDESVGVDPLSGNEAILMRSADSTFLAFDGHRARVDTANGAVTRALGIDGKATRQVSAALLGTIRETAPIEVPKIEGAGQPGPGALRQYAVGTVVQLGEGTATRFFVVLRSGVQEIGQLAADLVRFADSHGQSSIPRITPDALGSIPAVTELNTAGFPQTSPSIIDRDVACSTWGPNTPTRLFVGAKAPVPAGARPVELVQRDGTGPKVDAFYLPVGTGVFAKAVQTQSSGGGGDSLHYLSDTGVRYGVTDAGAAKMLGLTDPEPIPWSILGLLAAGPALGREEAFVAHDGLEAGGATATIEPTPR